MSIKKTWFSYILWLIATGFSILFTYSYIEGIITCYSYEQFKAPYFMIGFSAAFVLAALLLYILISKILSRIKEITIPKWGRRMFHILVLCGMTVLFIVTRYMVLWSTTLENVVPMNIYEAARVMSGNGQSALQEELYVFEKIYINILSGLFLFLGNKIEVMLYFQIFLQAASFLLLLFIGRTLQKGFLGWFPAMVYVLSQYCMDTVLSLNSGNFWFFLSVLCIAVICILERAWKNKLVTYILIVVYGIGFAVLNAVDAFPHVTDWNEVFKTNFTESLVDGPAAGFWSFLILAALMIFYSISFWKTKIDNVSAYILPIVCFTAVMYAQLTSDTSISIFMLIRIYFSFMAAEGLRILFEARPKLFTGQDVDKDMETVAEPVEKEEANDLPEDTGVIRVSDILKTMENEKTMSESNASVTETEMPSIDEVVDKTAMIENVLPMPKKHVSRSFEYAFEPTEDMMHYDVEVENDDYDYE